MSVFDRTACALGEGPLWHPGRRELFWFDILGQRLHRRGSGSGISTRFDDLVSAAGWVDDTTLLIASASGLWRYDIETEAREALVALEADNPVTRSNDGRADPWGGFWIGTMGRSAEAGAGAIYRFHEGALRRLYTGLTVTNAISFAPDRSHACFADTARQQVMRVALDSAGWPAGEPSVFLDLASEGLYPDGAVFDAAGLLWLALWGAGSVHAYAPDGTLSRRIEVPADQTTCPAFGGAGLTDLFVTSAACDLPPAAVREKPEQGMTFRFTDVAQGLPENRVVLPTMT